MLSSGGYARDHMASVWVLDSIVIRAVRMFRESDNRADDPLPELRRGDWDSDV